MSLHRDLVTARFLVARNIQRWEVSNGLMGDLKSKWAIYLKAALFLVIGGISVGLLVAQNFRIETVVLVGLAIWSFCRAYYFAFYVIEHYVDPNFRFAGLFDLAMYFLRRR